MDNPILLCRYIGPFEHIWTGAVSLAQRCSALAAEKLCREAGYSDVNGSSYLHITRYMKQHLCMFMCAFIYTYIYMYIYIYR